MKTPAHIFLARQFHTGRAAAASLAFAGVAALGLGLAAGPVATRAAPAEAAPITAAGVIRAPSAYGFDETVERLKADIAAKGVKFFDEIDQGQLATDAKIGLRPSKLLLFGNPPLGVQFLTSNPYAGLDWPVRMLVLQDADGKVWVAYTDFAWIARRYGIQDRDPALEMATKVAASIAASVGAKALAPARIGGGKP